MKTYVRELSEVRMIRRAPTGPLPLSEVDRAYVVGAVQELERAFGLSPCAGVDGLLVRGSARFDPHAWSARALVAQLIDWWRSLAPSSDAEREAYNRLPGAIRLIDTVSTWVEEQASRQRSS